MNETQQGPSAAQPSAAQAGTPILVLKKLDKRFGATHALKAVDLVFEAGEKHPPFGGKGARQTTLLKPPTRLHLGSTREGYLGGKPGRFAPPHAAIEHGNNPLHPQGVL